MSYDGLDMRFSERLSDSCFVTRSFGIWLLDLFSEGYDVGQFLPRADGDG